MSPPRDLKVGLDWGDEEVPVGRLVDSGQALWFAYDGDFVDRGIQLSPFMLPLRRNPYERHGGLWGVFQDSLPDSFGRKALKRELARLGLPGNSVIDLLAVQGGRAMGALTYRPNHDAGAPGPQAVELGMLANDAMDLHRQPQDEALRTLAEGVMRAAGTAGGARPKVVVGRTPDGRIWPDAGTLPDDAARWLVKFTGDDPAYVGALEGAYLEMAGASGINVHPHEVLRAADGQRYFATKRFDREGRLRRHMHTFGSLAVAGDASVSDYADLLGVTLSLTRSQREVQEGARRMVFNLLVGNRDDHERNFAFLLDRGGEWHVSPAFDLTWTPDKGEHTMLVSGKGRGITRADCLAVTTVAGLRPRQLDSIVEQVMTGVSQWGAIAERYELPASVRDGVQATIEAQERLLLNAGGRMR